MNAKNVGDPCGCPTACYKPPYLRCAMTGEINPPKCEVCGQPVRGEVVKFNTDGSNQRFYHSACFARK